MLGFKLIIMLKAGSDFLDSQAFRVSPKLLENFRPGILIWRSCVRR